MAANVALDILTRLAQGRGEMMHVGEGGKDEFAFFDPGSDGMAVVAPRAKGTAASPEGAMMSLMQFLMGAGGGGAPQKKLTKAAGGAVVDPQVFNGSGLLQSLLQMLQGTGTQLAVDVPRTQASIFDLLGFAVPSLFGITDPAKFREGLGSAISGNLPTTPTLRAQELRTQRELRGLSSIPGAGQIPTLGGPLRFG